MLRGLGWGKRGNKRQEGRESCSESHCSVEHYILYIYIYIYIYMFFVVCIYMYNVYIYICWRVLLKQFTHNEFVTTATGLTHS